MEGTMAEIRGFAGNFAPRNWAYCAGQLLSIAQNSALFSLLGTTYGGDGRTTFGLPALRGRVPIGHGQGPGLRSWPLGARTGLEYTYLNVLNLPQHTHTTQSSVTAGSGVSVGTAQATVNINNTTGNHQEGNGKFLGFSDGGGVYADTSDNSTLASGAVTVDTSNLGVNVSYFNGNVTIGYNGASQEHNNMQPWLAINWIICMFGTYPSRN